MVRKREQPSQAMSEGSTHKRDTQHLPADWRHHLDKPGDPNYLGVSEVFRRFAEPILDGATQLTDITAACRLAMLAWNLAMVPPHTRLQLVSDAVKMLSNAEQLPTRQCLEVFIARKEQLFGAYRWCIGDVHVESCRRGIRLVVAARELDESGSTPI
jgi:hypothetical protein